MNKKVLSKAILVVCICTFLFSGYQLFTIHYNYSKAVDEYDSLTEQYVCAPAEKPEIKKSPEEKLSYPPVTIDFKALRAINADIVGWLYVEACEISYPVVQTDNNDYYLYHTFERQDNSCGAIFMDCANDPSFLNYNTFLYGHNMKNDTMFGRLSDLRTTEKLCDEKPYIYVYLENEVLKYQIFSYYITTDTSDSYRNFSTEKEYQAYIKKVGNRSEYATTLDFSTENPLLSLSTCSGLAGGNQRFLVHSVLIGDYTYQ